MSVTKRLYRSCSDRILGGVAGGLGEYFDIDPTLIRLIIAISFFAGFGFLAYLLAWVIIPQDPKCDNGKTGADEIKQHAEKVADEIHNAVKKDNKGHKHTGEDFRFWLGLIIIFIAVSILLQNFVGFGLWHNFWPIILVAFGVVLIAGSMERK